MYNTPVRDEIDATSSELIRKVPRVPSSGTIQSTDHGYDSEVKKSIQADHKAIYAQFESILQNNFTNDEQIALKAMIKSDCIEEEN